LVRGHFLECLPCGPAYQQAASAPKFDLAKQIKLVCFDTDQHPNRLPITTEDYLKFVEWTGRVMHAGKSGMIADDVPSIFEKLDLDSSQFRENLPKLSEQHAHCIGRKPQLEAHARALAQRDVKGQRQDTAIS
jgi:hypothetical protein